MITGFGADLASQTGIGLIQNSTEYPQLLLKWRRNIALPSLSGSGP